MNTMNWKADSIPQSDEYKVKDKCFFSNGSCLGLGYINYCIFLAQEYY